MRSEGGHKGQTKVGTLKQNIINHKRVQGSPHKSSFTARLVRLNAGLNVLILLRRRSIPKIMGIVQLDRGMEKRALYEKKKVKQKKINGRLLLICR